MIDEDGHVVHEVRFAHPVERVWNTDLPTDPRGRFDSGWVEKFDDLARFLKGAT